jgi:hypothetical protein
MPEASETSCAIEAGKTLTGELVDPALPVHLRQLAGEALPELRPHLVLPAAPHALDCGVRVRLTSAATPADPASLDTVEPFVAERAEGRTSIRELGQVVGGLGSGGEPDQHLAAVLARLAPDWLARCRVPAPASPRRLAAAWRVRVREGRAGRGVGDVDARESRLPPVRHGPFSGGARKVAPGDRRGTGLSGTEGFAGVRWGRSPTTVPRELPATARKTANNSDAGGGTRTPDTRIMIPLL